MYAADNADTIAHHFYEQGKADAIKDIVAKSKNITKMLGQLLRRCFCWRI